MTLPSERTKAVVQAREFLELLRRDEALPESIRCEAFRLLRHFPRKTELVLAGKLEAAHPLGVGPVFSPVFDE